MMHRLWLLAALLVIAAGVAACGPSITVSNSTQIPVRAVVSAGGTRQVLSPSPGESSLAEVKQGAYRLTVIPDAEWIEYAKTTRKLLNDQLANADSLTGAQLLDVIRRLKEIAQRMQQFEQAANSSASCSGTITDDSAGAFVEVRVLPDGKLGVTCK